MHSGHTQLRPWSDPDMFSRGVPLGLVNIVLSENQTLRVPSGEDFASSVMQNQGEECIADPRYPELAKSVSVSRPERNAWGSPLANSLQAGPAVSSCVAFMCGCFRGLRGARRPSFLSAGHTHRVSCAFHRASLCSKMGSVCEMV